MLYLFSDIGTDGFAINEEDFGDANEDTAADLLLVFVFFLFNRFEQLD